MVRGFVCVSLGTKPPQHASLRPSPSNTQEQLLLHLLFVFFRRHAKESTAPGFVNTLCTTVASIYMPLIPKQRKSMNRHYTLRHTLVRLPQTSHQFLTNVPFASCLPLPLCSPSNLSHHEQATRRNGDSGLFALGLGLGASGQSILSCECQYLSRPVSASKGKNITQA